VKRETRVPARTRLCRAQERRKAELQGSGDAFRCASPYFNRW